ncbi:MAG: 3,4-dehydroadipyl-CoA semialdehyde dehydrogenase [Planctomycetes bacterium]|nr:3,4-dehydroadipyl-CoA semialdehyde dehydrogenase [Planctomycetota bacterium]
MQKLKNYLCDRWVEGEGVQTVLLNPANGEAVAQASSAGIDYAAAFAHARETGGAKLRAMTFAERGRLLKAMSAAIHEHREELIEIGMLNAGNTRGDAKFDIDGAVGTLAAYAYVGKTMGETRNWLDGEAIDMGQSSRMQGRHLRVPRRGVAILINAYNFPAWGMMEKAACALLAGMPVISKPGTITAMLAHRIVEILVERGIMPAGSFGFVCGSAGDMLDHVEFQDCIAFTGSASTGKLIRSHPRVLEKGVRVNVEADSLNCAILGPDVEPDTETFDLFVRDVTTDLTQKAGQKCTAIRRVIVPEAMVEPLRERLVTELGRVKLGVPGAEGVRMGPLAGPAQLADAREKLKSLLAVARPLIGDPDRVEAIGDPEGKGAFMAPLVLLAPSAEAAPAVHEVEVFGPVATVVPYDGSAARAAAISAMGEGGLVASFYSDDRDFAAELIETMAPNQGRLVWGSKRSAASAPTPGTVFPQFIHGGPGRAGCGEELGGERGLEFFSQRVAVQGFGPMLDRLFTTREG